MDPNFLVIESMGMKVGISHNSISAWKLSRDELTLHMISGHSYTYHVSIVKNFIAFLEDNSLLIDKTKPDEKSNPEEQPQEEEGTEA